MADKKTTLVAVDVINGDYGNGDERVIKLKRKGYNPKVIQDEVNRLMTESRKKSIDTLAHEVIDGLWRSGKKREKVLKACKCNYNAIQNRVNEILNPPSPDKKEYTGKYPTLRLKKTNAQVIADTVKWAKWIAGDNRFHYGHGDHAHHNGCYFCGTNGAKRGYMKMWEHTCCCNPFVHSCFAHGGLVPSMLSMCMNGRSYGFKRGEGYDTSNLFKKISRSEAKAGDVFCSDCHVALYIGNGKIVHAGSEDDDVPYSDSWNRSICIGEWKDKYYDPPRVYRFIGSVDCDRPISYGEVSDRVGDLQRYMIWGGWLAKGEDDREFGDKTLTAVKNMQKALGVTPDGWVGQDTLKAMHTYRK